MIDVEKRLQKLGIKLGIVNDLFNSDHESVDLIISDIVPIFSIGFY